MVNELGAIICLEGFGCGAELCCSVDKEFDKMPVHLRFVAQWECPAVMGKIIEYDEIIFKTGVARHGRCPHITM